MNTNPPEQSTDGRTGTGRLLHLLKYPEQHDGDGEHLPPAGGRAPAMIESKTRSLRLVPKVGRESLQAITTKRHRFDHQSEARRKETLPPG
jgi:hypothetical protein